MEAIQREILSHNWITLTFVFSLSVLFFLKLFNPSTLKGYVTSIFNKGFVEIIAVEKYQIFSFFHIGFAFFSFLMLSISTYFVIRQQAQKEAFLLFDYLKVSSYLLLFVFTRFLLEFLLIELFEIKEKLAHFLFSKRSYSYSISIGLFILNIVYFYSFQNQSFLLIGGISLLSIRFFLIVFYNKNLIIKELFYFILYLCAFELAPLFILFKLIF